MKKSTKKSIKLTSLIKGRFTNKLMNPITGEII